MSLLNARFENSILGTSSITAPKQWLTDFFGGSPTSSGQKINPDTAISISTVFNAITLISESIAKLPVAPYMEEEAEYNGKKRHNKVKLIKHPTYRLISKEPNEWMSAFTWKKIMQIWVLKYDRAYSLITRNMVGTPMELFPLHPDWVTAMIDGKGNILYEVKNVFSSGEVFHVKRQDMFHLIGFTDDGLEGRSRVDLLKEELGNVKAAEQFSGQFYGKGITVSGFIKTPKLLKDAEAVNRLKTSFVQKYGGANGQFGVGVLEDGAEWIKNEIDAEKSQLIETRTINAKVAARIWNVPLPLLKQLEDATLSNVEQLDIQFTKYTLSPWLTNWEQEYERKLLSYNEKKRGDISFIHDVRGLLRGDMDTFAKFAESMQKTGAWSPNDILQELGMNGYDGGDIHVVNPGAITVEQLENGDNLRQNGQTQNT